MEVPDKNYERRKPDRDIKPGAKSPYRIIQLLRSENQRLRQEEELSNAEREKLRQLAYHDSHLPFLLNINGFKEEVTPQVKTAVEHGFGITIVFADMDNLKEVNDAYDHNKGDQILELLGRILEKYFQRSSDTIALHHSSGSEPDFSSTVAKWGGDEFLLALPLTPIEDANNLLEEARSEFEQRAAELVDGMEPSFSFGTARMDENLPDDATVEKFLADEVIVQNYDPDGMDAGTVLTNALRVAEMKMYAEKQDRKVGRATDV